MQRIASGRIFPHWPALASHRFMTSVKISRRGILNHPYSVPSQAFTPLVLRRPERQYEHGKGRYLSRGFLMLLNSILKGIVKQGSLTVIDHRGQRHHFGEPPNDNTVVVRLHKPSTARRLAFNPKLALGEAYMDGDLTVEKGSIYDFLVTIVRNLGPHGEIPFSGLQRFFERLTRLWHQFNPESAATRRVRHHYDLDGRLYDLFLDTDKQYSCAYFPPRTRRWNRPSWRRSAISLPS
jgi:Cyclopropane fatty acid synthase and related methyltransferases